MQKETLEKYQIIANIFAIVAIPVLLGIFGWVIQNQMKEKEIRRDFVQIAISVLSEKTSTENGNLHLKNWAARLLAQSSPVEFKSEELEAFIYNEEGFESLRRRASENINLEVSKSFIRAALEASKQELEELRKKNNKDLEPSGAPE